MRGIVLSTEYREYQGERRVQNVKTVRWRVVDPRRVIRLAGDSGQSIVKHVEWQTCTNIVDTDTKYKIFK